MSAQARSHLCVLLAFVGATILVTWPLAAKLTAGIPHGGDSYQFLWNGWWVSKAYADPELGLWWTPYQYAPHGASLYLHDLSPLNAHVQAWLRPIVGDFGAYNLLILFHYVLGAWGAYILAWYLTGNRAASVVAGVIYGFSTHHAMHLSQLSTVSSGWLPLSVFYLLKYVRDGGWRDGILALLVIVAAALSHWYYFVFCGLTFFGLMAIGQVGLREDLSERMRWRRAVVVWCAVLLTLSRILFAAWREAASRPVEWRIEIGKMYFLDPFWLVLPPPSHPIWGGMTEGLQGTIPGNATEGVVTVGIVAAVLGLLAWFHKNPTTRAWCWLGLILFLLALGPTITVLGQSVGIPGPFRLWLQIPGLNLVRVPARFVGPFTLAVGVASAGWIAGLGPEWRKGWRRAVTLWGLPSLIILETLAIPVHIEGKYLQHPAFERLPEIYAEATGETKPPELIVNFPTMPERVQFLYQQTIHELPTVDGALSNPPPRARDFLTHFNWNPEFLRELGVDLVLYQPWAAKTSLGEVFRVPESEKIVPEWRGKKVEPIVFFRDVMGYETAYEDERLIVLIP